MTLTLLVIALIAAANPFRARAARSETADTVTAVAAAGATVVLSLGSALLSRPLLDLVDVSGPNARIAAGIALLVVALEDVFIRPPSPEPALPGWRAGVIPLAFPVMFSPAFALLVIAGASERGIALTLAASIVALLPAALLLRFVSVVPARLAIRTVGVAGVGIAALVVLDGVYAI